MKEKKRKSIFQRLAEWYKEKKYERELEKNYQKKLKDIKKRDPYTYD